MRITFALVGSSFADLAIHRDSAYSIENGALIWQGEGWSEEGGLTQQLDPMNAGATIRAKQYP